MHLWLIIMNFNCFLKSSNNAHFKIMSWVWLTWGGYSVDGFMVIVWGLWQKCDYGGDVMTVNTRSKGIRIQVAGGVAGRMLIPVKVISCSHRFSVERVGRDWRLKLSSACTTSKSKCFPTSLSLWLYISFFLYFSTMTINALYYRRRNYGCE